MRVPFRLIRLQAISCVPNKIMKDRRKATEFRTRDYRKRRSRGRQSAQTMIPNPRSEYSPDDNLSRLEERVLPNATTGNDVVADGSPRKP